MPALERVLGEQMRSAELWERLFDSRHRRGALREVTKRATEGDSEAQWLLAFLLAVSAGSARSSTNY